MIGNWLRATLEKLSRKSDTAATIQYALNLWPALLRYCDNGIIEIDNSADKRALRGVAIGRRNYLFAGADSGGVPPPPGTAPRSSLRLKQHAASQRCDAIIF